MEGKRLIIPKRTPHHHRRAMGLLAVGLVGVLGIWAVQMKLTFADFSAKQPNTSFADAADRLERGVADLKPSEEAMVEMGAFAEQVKSALEASQAASIAAETEVAEPVTTDTAAAGEGGEVAAFPPAAPEGVVAGVQTEASN